MDGKTCTMPKYLKTIGFSLLICTLILLTLFQQKLSVTPYSCERETSLLIENMKQLTHKKNVYFELYNKQKEKIATLYDPKDFSPNILKQLFKNELIIVSQAVLPTPRLALPTDL